MILNKMNMEAMIKMYGLEGHYAVHPYDFIDHSNNNETYNLYVEIILSMHGVENGKENL